MGFMMMNAAGSRAKTIADIEILTAIPTLTEVTLGSITVAPRNGNSGNAYWTHPISGASLNSLGLPNPGAEWYEKNLVSMANAVHRAGKDFRVSVAGFTIDEYIQLVGVAAYGGADTIELNLGCPNVWGAADQKGIVSFSPELIRRLLTDPRLSIVLATRRLALKLSPFSDPQLLVKVAEVITQSTIRQWKLEVVCCNTFPNAFAFNNVVPAIGVSTPVAGKSMVGLAGLSGRPMKHIALGNALQFRTHLPREIAVIVAGGIESGSDADDALRIGGAGFQVGTHFFNHGPRVFEEIVAGMETE